MTDKSKLGCVGFFGGATLAAVLHADGLAGKFAVVEYERASKIGGFYYAAQLFSEVGRNRVTEMQTVFAHYELGVGIEKNEVGIKSRCEAAFAGVAAG